MAQKGQGSGAVMGDMRGLIEGGGGAPMESWVRVTDAFRGEL